jgi:hypothetical protein
LPREIKNLDEFIKLSENAEVCKIKKLKKYVKLKLRQKDYLYTYITTPDKSEEIIKKIKCSTEEV